MPSCVVASRDARPASVCCSSSDVEGIYDFSVVPVGMSPEGD